MDAGIYLENNFGPVDEELTETTLDVIGDIPRDLNGRYLRNGPNPLGAVDPKQHHWFIGDGMIHGVRLREGNADWYRNRWVRSEKVASDLGEPAGGRRLGGTNNTHVIGCAGRILALVEAGAAPVELDFELNTVGVNDFFGTLKDQAFTAHPKIDPDTGDLHAMAYHWPDFMDHVQYVHVGRDGKVKRTVNIPVPGMIMLHDMSLTAQFVVIYDLPVTVSLELVQQGFRFPFAWNPDYAPRVGLMPRTGDASDILWCEVEPCYVFHPMNAYDDADGNVVIDLCRYETMFARDHHGPLQDSLPTLDRWTINPRTRKVSTTRIDERNQEFPRCHPGLSSKPYRFGYTLGVAAGGDFTSIHKHDLATGARTTHELAPGMQSGEPYFVPRAGAETEDDGYLLSYVFDPARGKSELRILDARDLTRDPLARVLLPGRVPHGFHGAWVPEGWDGPSV